MFQSFYQLREQPFDANPDPRFLYLSRAHREALSSLLYRIQIDSGFIAMMAQPGMGKTMLLFHLLSRLQSTAKTAFIFQTQCTSHELLQHLLSEFECDTTITDSVRMYQELKSFLLREANAGRRCVLIIDEAQNLRPEVLETIRLLSNFETPRRKLLQIILSGQSELDGVLSRPELRQLRQRLSCMIHIQKFSPEDVVLYIAHRLSIAGYTGHVSQLFSTRALARIAQLSDGIPRVINNICFNALSLGFALEFKEIDLDIVEEVASDLGLLGNMLGDSSTSLPYQADLPYPGATPGWDANSEQFAAIAAVCAAQEHMKGQVATEANSASVAGEQAPAPAKNLEDQPDHPVPVAHNAHDHSSGASEEHLAPLLQEELLATPLIEVEPQTQPEFTPDLPAIAAEDEDAKHPVSVLARVQAGLSNLRRTFNGHFLMNSCATLLVLCIAPAVNSHAPPALSVQAATASVRGDQAPGAGSSWLKAPPLIPVSQTLDRPAQPGAGSSWLAAPPLIAASQTLDRPAQNDSGTSSAQQPSADSSTRSIQSHTVLPVDKTQVANHTLHLEPQLAEEIADSKRLMHAGPPNAIPVAIPVVLAAAADSTSKDGP